MDDPIVPMLEDGAHRDGQILPFYVKWWNLTVPKCTRLRFWTHRIVHIDPRVLQVPFRCSEKQHTFHTDLPFGKIGHHMGQHGALAWAWGALFRNGAVAHAKRVFLASLDDTWDEKTGPRWGVSWAVALKRTRFTAE